MAGALGIRLGGSSIYFGQVSVKPTIGDGQQVSAGHILVTNRLMLLTMSLTLLLLSFFSSFFY